MVQDWEVDHRAFWDTAVRGNSSLRAALARRLLDETAATVGAKCGALYVDIKKFFDSLVPELLMDELQQM